MDLGLSSIKHPPSTKAEVDFLIEKILAQAQHACRCISTDALGYNSPGSLVFGRDMFINLPLEADLLSIQQAHQQKIDKRLVYANAKRHPYNFKVNDQVFCLTDRSSSNKLKPVYTGPHQIETVHTNGTVVIRRGPNIRDRVNIRHLKLARLP